MPTVLYKKPHEIDQSCELYGTKFQLLMNLGDMKHLDASSNEIQHAMPPTAHSNMKAANVLLDKEGPVPGIYDCWQAVLNPITNNRFLLIKASETVICDTELVQPGVCIYYDNTKGCIYAFPVVLLLLEPLTGREPLDRDVGSIKNQCDLLNCCLDSNCIPPVAHSKMKAAIALFDDDFVHRMCDCWLALLTPFTRSSFILAKTSEMAICDTGSEQYQIGIRNMYASPAVLHPELLSGRKKKRMVVADAATFPKEIHWMQIGNHSSSLPVLYVCGLSGPVHSLEFLNKPEIIRIHSRLEGWDVLATSPIYTMWGLFVREGAVGCQFRYQQVQTNEVVMLPSIRISLHERPIAAFTSIPTDEHNITLLVYLYSADQIVVFKHFDRKKVWVRRGFFTIFGDHIPVAPCYFEGSLWWVDLRTGMTFEAYDWQSKDSSFKIMGHDTTFLKHAQSISSVVAGIGKCVIFAHETEFRFDLHCVMLERTSCRHIGSLNDLMGYNMCMTMNGSGFIFRPPLGMPGNFVYMITKEERSVRRFPYTYGYNDFPQLIRNYEDQPEVVIDWFKGEFGDTHYSVLSD